MLRFLLVPLQGEELGLLLLPWLHPHEKPYPLVVQELPLEGWVDLRGVSPVDGWLEPQGTHYERITIGTVTLVLFLAFFLPGIAELIEIVVMLNDCHCFYVVASTFAAVSGNRQNSIFRFSLREVKSWRNLKIFLEIPLHLFVSFTLLPSRFVH